MQEDREARTPPAADAPDASPSADGEQVDATPKPAVHVETPPEDEEMGGEQPCQLHRFWDVPEE